MYTAIPIRNGSEQEVLLSFEYRGTCLCFGHWERKARILTTSPTIYEDALRRPDLFHWFGVIEAEFERWLTALPLRVHPGLVSFWRRTGGGDLFESETLLGPLVKDEGDSVLKLTEYHWSKGLPRDLLIFHTGLCISASFVDRRRHRNRLVSLRSGSYQVERQFDTFNEWYQKTIRAEYAERYDLNVE